MQNELLYTFENAVIEVQTPNYEHLLTTFRMRQ